ncbi:hypothetical protein [Geosporobacter ferrireducens]|uniref:hypothetical protein n=1 Tax=Geosporobacter ferrireducens TaxID=1424294 RepID=UPI00139E9715|nr:hypothetical protein [Geosporobacter ferrireducens]MTI56160.1 hypothetical protein [Geosporobacter ferrireducens]
MATVSTALKMFDSFSRPLQQVTQALNITISAMEQMADAANMDTKFAAQMNVARSKVQQAEAAFKQVIDQQDRMVNKQNQVNNAISRGSNEANGMLSKIKGIAVAYGSFRVVRKGIDLVIGGSARLEQQLITMSGMLGNKDVGKAFFGNLNTYANDSVYGIKEFNAITRQLIQFTKNTDNLMALNKTAERLAFLDPTQGLEGAGFALKEALGGDFMSLKGRFGFGSQDRALLQSAKSMDDFIEKFNLLLDRKGATQQALEEFNSSAIAQFNNLGSNIEAAFAQAGEMSLEALKPALQMLNQGFKAGEYQPFFDAIAIGAGIIGQSIAWVFQNGSTMADGFINILGNVTPPIFGIVGALAMWRAIQTGGTIGTAIHASAIKGYQLITGKATLTQLGLNKAMLLNPIGLVTLLIVGLIAAMVAFGDTTNGIRGIFSNAFGYIVDTAEWTVNAVLNTLNKAIKGINSVSGFFGKLLGVDAFQIRELEMKADFSGFKMAGQDLIKNASFDDIKAKFGLGKLDESFMAGDQNSLLKDWSQQQNDNFGLANDNLKGVNDKLDISNEKLELMRDLAEQQVINRFTTATLAPQISLMFGDVRETADLDGIIPHVEKILTEQLMIAAEGVHV